MLSPDTDLNESTNSTIAMNAFNAWIERAIPTIDVLVLFLTKLESVTAECHRVMAGNKVRGKLITSKRDQKKLEESLDERLNPATPKTAKKVEKKSTNKIERAQSLLAELDGTPMISQDETKDFLKQLQEKMAEKLALRANKGK